MGSWMRFCNQTGWVHRGDHVALCTILVGLCSSLGVVPNYIVLVIDNEGARSDPMQARHARGYGLV